MEPSSRAEARRQAAAVRMESRMMKTLSQIAETRQRLASGQAKDRELRSAVKQSLKLAVNSTNRMIQLAAEVLIYYLLHEAGG